MSETQNPVMEIPGAGLILRRSSPMAAEAFADCWLNSNETRALFNALFPKRPSQIYPLS